MLAIVCPTGCSKLLGISGTDGGGEAGDDALADSMFDAPPPCMTFDVGGSGQQFAIGDVDRDSKPEIVVGIGTDTMILLGDGTGHFGAANGIGTPADGVIIDDFDTDGFNDLVLWNSTGVVERVSTAGAFLAAQPLDGPFQNINRVIECFFDGAFVPDLVVEDDLARRIFTGNLGSGTFTREATTVGDAGDELLEVLDIDGLSRDDIAMVSGGAVKIALADPASSTQYLTPFTVGANVVGHGAAFGNLNGDAFLDLMTATAAGGIGFAQNVSDPRTYTQMPAGPFAGITGGTMQIIDVNKDGTDDVLSNRIVLQCPPPAAPGTFTQIVPVVASAPAALVDIDKDGKPDLVRLVGNTVKVRIQQ